MTKEYQVIEQGSRGATYQNDDDTFTVYLIGRYHVLLFYQVNNVASFLTALNLSRSRKLPILTLNSLNIQPIVLYHSRTYPITKDKIMTKQTNIERVTDYMQFGSPMKQAFVIEAISRYAKEIADNQKAVLEGMKHSLISPQAWITCAKEWQATEQK